MQGVSNCEYMISTKYLHLKRARTNAVDSACAYSRHIATQTNPG